MLGSYSVAHSRVRIAVHPGRKKYPEILKLPYTNLLLYMYKRSNGKNIKEFIIATNARFRKNVIHHTFEMDKIYRFEYLTFLFINKVLLACNL